MNPSAIVKPCQEKIFQQGNNFYCFDENSIESFNEEMLSPDYWQQQGAITGTAQGRGTTYFVRHLHDEWVLRHYYRGGLIGKFIHDSYLFTGFNKTRAAIEFNLLKTLSSLNLPAPKPIAYRVKKSGLCYQADILTARIANAQDLVAALSVDSIDAQIWHDIGRCIKAFHQQGIYHHDLNAHNILLDKNSKVWLIDFDRGEQRQPEKTWQQANIDRLLRSFKKEQAKLAEFHWQDKDWQVLLEGYLST
ncbi:3-deoxy-D-manno-octulosonic acid kinase [Thalassotalea castellviae]|uniref:3-deoxy-D-manno-octulosonic acid kinase n=1 Tax=Thalassotalea castellviae TaxID=3075612 RepID=A0ABU3A1V7_9GAMM|nr:3-deoxy-D-manno-octulosonic acid kinase [Thalassotalea sp. W431]MDT0604161.1 3-deoxy-D-manno-octulosonic acid kinase [Thalassotalea sp. W431]